MGINHPLGNSTAGRSRSLKRERKETPRRQRGRPFRGSGAAVGVVSTAPASGASALAGGAGSPAYSASGLTRHRIHSAAAPLPRTAAAPVALGNGDWCPRGLSPCPSHRRQPLSRQPFQWRTPLPAAPSCAVSGVLSSGGGFFGLNAPPPLAQRKSRRIHQLIHLPPATAT